MFSLNFTQISPSLKFRISHFPSGVPIRFAIFSERHGFDRPENSLSSGIQKFGTGQKE